MSTLNKAFLIGRLGQDPEVRTTQGGTTVANFSLATSSRYKDKNGEWKESTEWHKIVAWGRLAEIARDYLKKGSQVYIEGPLQTNKWQDKQGVDRFTTEIKALSITMLDSKSDGETSRGSSETVAEDELTDPENLSDDLKIDDNLPF